jgi:hypothetical protein
MPKNGNITGQVFDEDVIKQIETRQNFLGARYKNDSHLVYGNNSSAFLRLASSINVGTSSSPIGVTTQVTSSDGKKTTYDIINPAAQEKATSDLLSQGRNQLSERGINQNLTGMELAKSCVLFGGTVGVDNNLNPNFKFGIVDNGGSGAFDYISTIAAYGWGGIGSKGFIPMPSIESADVSFYNRGALQKATVKIKVYSLEQLQIFDILYFRIGYTMLLEWGHNIWLSNKLENNPNPINERNEFVTEPFKLFFTEGSSQQNIITAIQKQRKDDCYNYDAMLGKVTNFNWKFNDDGSYDIELKLVGLGDIIESLKVNKANIVTGKTDLTPSQIAEKGNANRSAAYDALDESETASQTKLAENKKVVQDEIDKLNRKVESYKPYVKSYSNTINDLVADIDDVRLTSRWNANQANIGALENVQFSNDASGLFDTKYAGLNAKTSIDSIIKRLKEIGEYKGAIKDKIDYLGEVADGISGVVDKKNLVGKVSEVAAQEAADLKLKQDNDRKRRGLDVASQAAKKEEEVRQLSPVTSVELKNKTSLNLQLYNWRQEAITGTTNKDNLYKLTLSANSSNPTSTGAAKLSLNFYYVRLGYLLEWVQNNLLLYDTTKLYTPKDYEIALKTGNLTQPTTLQNTQLPPKNANPIFTIDFNPERNYCLRFPAQFSSDPKVCIIPSKYPGKNIEGTVKWDVLPELKGYFVDNNDYAGKLMNIFVNIDHTAGCLDKNTDVNGKTNLLKFLSSLLDDINDVLGNVNKMEPVFDSEENQLKIIEGSSLEKIEDLINDKEKKENNQAVFQVYGIGTENTPYGSFITNVDFQVELPPNMAAMATISAQAGGNIVGENATGLSKLNKGFTDRLISVKLDRDSIEGAQTGKADPKKIFETNIQQVSKVVNSLYKDKFYSKDTIDSIRSANRDVALYLTGNDAIDNLMPSPFFIPFNLSLNMKGLSGMRNYERFSITEQILPYSYKSGDQKGVIDFLIKGISHKIDNNQWETKIESLTVSSNRKWKIKGLQ